MTEYYLNETVVTFPGNIIQDSTINMLRLSDPDAALIISRGQMQEGDELASQVEQQMKKLEKQVKELRYTPVQVTRVADFIAALCFGNGDFWRNIVLSHD